MGITKEVKDRVIRHATDHPAHSDNI